MSEYGSAGHGYFEPLHEACGDEIERLTARVAQLEAALADMRPKYDTLLAEVDAHDQESAYREYPNPLTVSITANYETLLPAAPSSPGAEVEKAPYVHRICQCGHSEFGHMAAGEGECDMLANDGLLSCPCEVFELDTTTGAEVSAS